VAATDLAQDSQQLLTGESYGLGEGQQDVLGGEVLVAEL
jgi:hypothetical protein